MIKQRIASFISILYKMNCQNYGTKYTFKDRKHNNRRFSPANQKQSPSWALLSPLSLELRQSAAAAEEIHQKHELIVRGNIQFGINTAVMLLDRAQTDKSKLRYL